MSANSKSLKICHVTSVHHWDDIRIFKKQCVSLAKEYDTVFLVAPNAPNEVVEGVHVVGVTNTTSRRIKRILTFRKKIISKALELDADLYQFHDPELLSYVRMFKRRGKLVIYDSHEDVPNAILTKNWIRFGWFRKIVSSFYNRFEKSVVKDCSGVISVLPGITSKFTNQHRETIYNYPIIDISESLPEVGHLKDEFKLIYNGGLTKIRGIKQICLAMDLLEDDSFRLELLGLWESEEFKNECLTSLRYKHRISDLGQVPYDVCQNHLRKAHVGLILFHPVPNHVYSLPNKSFEFIMNGLPVLLSSIEFWKKEFASIGIFADPFSPKEIAEKIKFIRANYSETRSKVITYREKVIREQSWESQEQKLYNFYNEIIETKRG